MGESNKPLVDAAEVARVLNVSPRAVTHWAQHGRIPANKVGARLWRFDLQAVLAAVGAAGKGRRRRKPASAGGRV
jgi:excisionase family DNA binding protein